MAMFSVHGLQQDFDGTLHMRWVTYIVETASYHAAAYHPESTPSRPIREVKKDLPLVFLP